MTVTLCTAASFDIQHLPRRNCNSRGILDLSVSRRRSFQCLRWCSRQSVRRNQVLQFWPPLSEPKGTCQLAWRCACSVFRCSATIHGEGLNKHVVPELFRISSPAGRSRLSNRWPPQWTTGTCPFGRSPCTPSASAKYSRRQRDLGPTDPRSWLAQAATAGLPRPRRRPGRRSRAKPPQISVRKIPRFGQ